ncbi:MAG TPA: segregation/condensation protein A [Anaeromyxobacteraceae bacterium]|nr:segregation/condensation protein A [Anaeromyxobacteraceae bacterium]
MAKASAEKALEGDRMAADGGRVTAPIRATPGAFRVTLPPFSEGEPPFEGPLDLLLHLVKEHEIDLFDIPIAKITEGYLATLEAMRELDIDIAGDFLQMAAQLALMKSKLLLPRTEVAEDAKPDEASGVDPRAELVRRLLEYQKYKAAAEAMGGLFVLERDVFVRRPRLDIPQPIEGPDGLADVSVFKLIEALDRALANARPELGAEVVQDRLSITDAISRVAEVLRARRRVSFFELLAGPDGEWNARAAVVATFLALLEMAKLRLIRMLQVPVDEAGWGSDLVVEAEETLGEDAPTTAEDYR